MSNFIGLLSKGLLGRSASLQLQRRLVHSRGYVQGVGKWMASGVSLGPSDAIEPTHFNGRDLLHSSFSSHIVLTSCHAHNPLSNHQVRYFTTNGQSRQQAHPRQKNTHSHRSQRKYKKTGAAYSESKYRPLPKPSLIASLMLDNEKEAENKENTLPEVRENIQEIEDLMKSIDNDLESSDTDSDIAEEEESVSESSDDEGAGEKDYLEEVELDIDQNEQEEDSQQNIYGLESGTGTPNPDIPISETPCSGCGALLHCQNTGIPGYMPSQRFTATPKEKLRRQVCQRCYLIQRHNVALKASVSPEEYRNIIRQVKDVRALIVVVVDVMDMPNSLFPNLTELIGKKRPLYIVGNKADMLPPDSRGYLTRLKNMIRQECEMAGFMADNYIKHVGLISAKTGFGIEDLATKLMVDWSRKGHIYILGCTNVGKSTLFNTLLSSDLCKETATDFINRASTSVWPGTTLNLLKFPLLNPEPWRLVKRTNRLRRRADDDKEEERLRRAIYRDESNREKYPSLMGHIGRTFEGTKNMAVGEEDSKGFSGATFSFNTNTGDIDQKAVDKDSMLGYDYNEAMYEKSRWCYDTPGVVNPEQIINLLTQHELSVLLTRKMIVPRTYILKPGQAMHVSGLGRIDLLSAEKSVMFTVFTSEGIPVGVRDISEMGAFYDNNIGTARMGIPLGDKDRLARLPGLVGHDLRVNGISLKHSAADVILSSIGWVAVTPGPGIEATIRAYTPGGVGCSLRTPALLPYAVVLRGKRTRSAAYTVKPLHVYEEEDH